MSATETFDIVLRVTARNLTREEAELQGFDLEEAEDYGDEPYDPESEPIDALCIGECIAGGFHDDAINEILAGSNLMATIEAVEFVGVQARTKEHTSHDL